MASSGHWTVVGSNAAGGLKAKDLRIRVDLPAKVAPPTSFDGAEWSCRYRPAVHRVVCNRNALAAGNESTIRFRTRLVRDGTRATSVARLDGATRDVATANNRMTTAIRLS